MLAVYKCRPQMYCCCLISNKDYLQKVNHDLITPLRQFHSNEFKEVYNLHSRYKRVLSKMYKPSKSPRNVQTPRGSMFDLSVLDDQSEEYINKRMVMCILWDSDSTIPSEIAMPQTLINVHTLTPH